MNARRAIVTGQHTQLDKLRGIDVTCTYCMFSRLRRRQHSSSTTSTGESHETQSSVCSDIAARHDWRAVGGFRRQPSRRRRRGPCARIRWSPVIAPPRSTGSTSFIARRVRPMPRPCVLLHGFPTSSHMFRNLMPALADRYHVIAPDYPGFGQSGTPDRSGVQIQLRTLRELMDGLLDQLGVNATRSMCRTTARRSGTDWRSSIPSESVRSWSRMATPMRRDSANSGIRSKPTGPTVRNASRSPARGAHPGCDGSQYVDGVRDRRASPRITGCTIRRCSTGPASTRSCSTCSRTTAATLRCIRSSRSSSAPASRRPSSSGERTT